MCQPTVAANCVWSLTLGTIVLKLDQCQLLKKFPLKLDSVNMVVRLLSCLNTSSFCKGNPDNKFAKIRQNHQGVFRDRSGKFRTIIKLLILFNNIGMNIVAYYDNRDLPCPTIRHIKCEYIVEVSRRCKFCADYRLHIKFRTTFHASFSIRPTLHVLASRSKPLLSSSATNSDSHVNFRYLSAAERKVRLRNLHQRNNILQMKIDRLTAKLDTILETSGVALDDNTSSDFQQIMVEAEEQVTFF